jgi:hypothetical protein
MHHMNEMNEMNGQPLTISCDDCSMRCTSACGDCVVTFVIGDSSPARHEPLILDLEQARVVRMFSRAGLIPDLKFQDAG